MTVSQSITVTGSQTTSGPGVYYIIVPGVTLTLETWNHWADSSDTITVKDVTHSGTPNITVKAPNVPGGSIDGAASVSIATQDEGLIFRPYKGGNSYGVISGGSGGGGGNWWVSLPDVGNGDPVPAAGLPFVNSSGFVVISQ
jgi:hypothetical protein